MSGLSGVKVGDKLIARNSYRPDEEVTVAKVGRKYLTTEAGHQFSLETGIRKDWCSVSVMTHEERDRHAAWSKAKDAFRMLSLNSYKAPDHLTIADVEVLTAKIVEIDALLRKP